MNRPACFKCERIGVDAMGYSDFDTFCEACDQDKIVLNTYKECANGWDRRQQPDASKPYGDIHVREIGAMQIELVESFEAVKDDTARLAIHAGKFTNKMSDGTVAQTVPGNNNQWRLLAHLRCPGSPCRFALHGVWHRTPEC